MSEQTIHCTEHDGAIVFKVRVVPRARQSGIAGVHDGALRVRVAAPPVDGAANEELARTLARALGVPRRAVEITGGHTSKVKQVCVRGASLIANCDCVQPVSREQPGARASLPASVPQARAMVRARCAPMRARMPGSRKRSHSIANRYSHLESLIGKANSKG